MACRWYHCVIDQWNNHHSFVKVTIRIQQRKTNIFFNSALYSTVWYQYKQWQYRCLLHVNILQACWLGIKVHAQYVKSFKLKQGQCKAWHIPSPKYLTRWPWKSIGFQILLRTKHVPSLVKIHWRMLILECSQGCYGRRVALLYPFATSLARE